MAAPSCFSTADPSLHQWSDNQRQKAIYSLCFCVFVLWICSRLIFLVFSKFRSSSILVTPSQRVKERRRKTFQNSTLEMNNSGDMDLDFCSNRPCPEENPLFSSPSFSSVEPSLCKYDVFISFRGEDCRHTFTTHLYSALFRDEIKAYTNQIRLEKGEYIHHAIPRAIEESAVSIIIFSPNYASSTWCLKELVHILKCRKEKSQIVIPIFLGVDPSDVRKQQRSYAVAFADHEQRFNVSRDMVQEWRQALWKASNLSEWDLRGMSESDIIEAVVRNVKEKLEYIWSNGRGKPESDLVRIAVEDFFRKLQSIPSMRIDASSSTTEPSNILPNGRRNITSWQKGALPGRGSFRSVRQVVEDVIRQLNTMVDASSSTMELSSPNGRCNITSWQKGHLLGRGSFGSVYEGITADGFFFAVKEVSLHDEMRVNQLEQEIALLSQFKHENIVQYYGTHKDGWNLYIFLELVTKGSLLSLYQNKKYTLGDSQVSVYTRHILQGLKYLHDQKVIHRDIKCANILVDASGCAKLADFGYAKVTKTNDVNSSKGSAFWMAPEVVNSKKQGYGLPADIWSLGCTVLEMLTQNIPYFGLEYQQALFKIGNGVPPSVPDSLSNDARDFIWKCLQVNPDARATAAELLNHSFVL